MLAPALRKLSQRAIHTSPVCSSAQAFRTRVHTFPCLFVGVGFEVRTHFRFSAQAFRTRRTLFPHFPCFFAMQHRLLERGINTFYLFVSAGSELQCSCLFTNWTTTHTHINRHINWQQHAIVEAKRVVKAFDESYGSIDSWGQLSDGIV